MVTDQPTVDTPFHRIGRTRQLDGEDERTFRRYRFAARTPQSNGTRRLTTTRWICRNRSRTSLSASRHGRRRPPCGRPPGLGPAARCIDGGISQETLSNIHNGNMNAEQALKNANDAYEFKKDILRSVFSYGPGGDSSPTHSRTSSLGLRRTRMTSSSISPARHRRRPHIGGASVQRQITQAQYTVASEFIHEGNSHIDERFFDDNGKLKPPSHIPADDWSLYDSQLTVAMAQYTEIDSMLGKFSDTFGHVGGYQHSDFEWSRSSPRENEPGSTSCHRAALLRTCRGMHLARRTRAAREHGHSWHRGPHHRAGWPRPSSARITYEQSWSDDGRRAAELFDVDSTGRAVDRPVRRQLAPGRTAHEPSHIVHRRRKRDSISRRRRPILQLWQAYAQSLVPYLGAIRRRRKRGVTF